MYKRKIIVKLEVEGIHQWAECPIKAVEFLRNPHRHIFHITCKKEVIGNDRDIEIIMFKRSILSYLHAMHGQGDIVNFGNMSCEAIAEELCYKFNLSSCKVLEDNENGAKVYRKD